MEFILEWNSSSSTLSPMSHRVASVVSITGLFPSRCSARLKPRGLSSWRPWPDTLGRGTSLMVIRLSAILYTLLLSPACWKTQAGQSILYLAQASLKVSGPMASRILKGPHVPAEAELHGLVHVGEVVGDGRRHLGAVGQGGGEDAAGGLGAAAFGGEELLHLLLEDLLLGDLLQLLEAGLRLGAVLAGLEVDDLHAVLGLPCPSCRSRRRPCGRWPRS